MKKINNIKVYLSIVLSLAVIYCASIGICYNNAKDRIADDFNSESWQIAQDLTYLWESNIVYSPQSFIGEYNYKTFYPYRVVIYDNDFNEIERTGPCIRFTSNLITLETEYCFLADYLTDDIVNLMNSNFDKGNWISSFSYYYQGEKVIPVEIQYKDKKAQVVDRVKFTDINAEYETVKPTNMINLDGLDYLDYEEKYYEQLDSLIDNNGVFDKYNDTENGETQEGEFYWYTQVSFLEEDSKDAEDFRTYNVMVAAMIDYDEFALHDYGFKNNVVILTLIFIAACAVLLAGAYVIIKKYNLNSVRYAFTNAAAHELKTPLAVIENRCEFILEGVNGEKTNEYVNSIYKESLRMNSLLAKLLRYNKLASVSSVKKEQADLSAIVNNELQKYENSAAGKEIKINSNIIENAEVNCNIELISLAVDNYLSNAVHFASSNSEVNVSLKKHKKGYMLTVINQYSGLLDDNIWDMLYTDNKARSDKSTGMGLPICKEIFELHRYKYGFKCSNGTVEFYFIAK